MVIRWVYIVLSFWLINSVTYIHASSPADYASAQHSNPASDACVKINTWADCVIQSLLEDNDDAAGKAHKIKYQRRYVRSRSVDDHVFISSPNVHFWYQQLKNAAIAEVNHYSIGVALLPSYYNFLFRLCPF